MMSHRPPEIAWSGGIAHRWRHRFLFGKLDLSPFP